MNIGNYLILSDPTLDNGSHRFFRPEAAAIFINAKRYLLAFINMAAYNGDWAAVLPGSNLFNP